MELKGKFYRMVVRPILLYGSKSWANKKELSSAIVGSRDEDDPIDVRSHEIR